MISLVKHGGLAEDGQLLEIKATTTFKIICILQKYLIYLPYCLTKNNPNP